MIALATLLVGVSLGLPSFAAAWATPGAACTQEGANANSDGFLTCTGGVWVSNAVLLGTTSATCDSTKAGYIRYTGGQFEGCNGTGWIQLASSSSLKVYKSDGVTELGKMMGNYASGCGGLVFARSDGEIFSASTLFCEGGTIQTNILFTGDNCTGSPYSQHGDTQQYLGYCCTGSAQCLTNKCIGSGGKKNNVNLRSYRATNGLCAANITTLSSLYLAVPICSDNGTACIVK
ncbi:MAG: hypothetical protein IPI58_03735 [Alphaproteobacteria bacterium]|nr:MAG: hypothetical protein IPI58_03735 [Alphaproteobacteria bacterium]